MNQRLSDFGYSEIPKHKALEAIVATAHFILNSAVRVMACPLFTKTPHGPIHLFENRLCSLFFFLMPLLLLLDPPSSSSS